MKFQKYFADHQVPEWSRKYLDYKRFKELLTSVSMECAGSIISRYTIFQILDGANDVFTDLFHDELRRCQHGKNGNTAAVEKPPLSQNSNFVSVNKMHQTDEFGLANYDRPGEDIGKPLDTHQEPGASPSALQVEQNSPDIALPDNASVDNRISTRLLAETISSEESNSINTHTSDAYRKIKDTANTNNVSISVQSSLHEEKQRLMSYPHLYDVMVWNDAENGDDFASRIFFRFLDRSLFDINTFFIDQLIGFERNYTVLMNRCLHFNSGGIREKLTLRQAILQLHRSLMLLKNFRILNFTAFGKILKKFDKIAKSSIRSTCMILIEHAPFYSIHVLEDLISQTQDLFINFAYDGDRKSAVKYLHVQEREISVFESFEAGALLGIAVTELVILAFQIAFASSNAAGSSFDFAPMFPVYRCACLLCLYIWLWGCVLYFFMLFHVNANFVLELDVRSSLSYIAVFRIAGFLTLIFLTMLNLFIFASQIANSRWGFNPGWISLAMFLSFWVFALCPFHIFMHRTRFFVLQHILNVITAPFGACAFVDMFIGDQITSFIVPFVDMAYSVCFFTTGTFLENDSSLCVHAVDHNAVYVIAILPYCFRILQCCHRWFKTKATLNVWNAMKYVSSITVSTLSYANGNLGVPSLLPAYIVFAVISSCYNGFWDLRFDWGILQPLPDSMEHLNPSLQKRRFLYPLPHLYRSNHQHRFLRRRLQLPSPIPYYFSAIADIGLRVSWLFTITPFSFGSFMLDKNYTQTAVAALEIIRRNQWNFYRLENEHLHNVEEFRAYQLVPIKPIEISDLNPINENRLSMQTLN